MGRHPDPDRRAALLAAATGYLERHGLAGLSLRPLAAALDTTPRTLLYHFGSKERLIDEALSASRERSPLRAVLTGESDATIAFPAAIAGIMARIWEKSTTAPTRPFLLLFYETYAAALRSPAEYRDFLGHAVAEWHEPFAAAITANGVPTEVARSLATRAIATHRGLLLDRLGCADPDRVDAAHRDFLRQFHDELSDVLTVRERRRLR